jgi:hypothetical protein
MYKNTLFSFTFLLIIVPSILVFAEDITEPESLMVCDAWLSSDPQPVVDHHVIKVCKDYAMTEECTQCIYGADSDGAVHIPTYNRCIFRPHQWSHSTQEVPEYNNCVLYYQVKAATAEGLESEWTETNQVRIYKMIENNLHYGSVTIVVTYSF